MVRIGAAANLSGSFVIIHTVQNNWFFRTSCLHIVNTSGAPVTVRVCVVPGGGSPDVTNALLWDFSIPANDLIELAEGLIMKPSSTCQALCSSAGAVNLFLSGTEN